MGLASSYKFSVSIVIPFTLSLYMYYAYLSILKISIQKLALYVYYFMKIDFLKHETLFSDIALYFCTRFLCGCQE
jgi:hypothetical protein